MNILAKTCVGAVVSILVAGAAHAGQLSVEVGKTVPVRIGGPASSVVVGNQNVAQVSAHSENLIFVTGKAYGQTNVLVFDRAGNQLYGADVNVTIGTNTIVTVNRAGEDHTFDCAPKCRQMLSTGDSGEYFDRLMEQHKDMQILTEGN